jgi:hypothetical protein
MSRKATLTMVSDALEGDRHRHPVTGKAVVGGE